MAKMGRPSVLTKEVLQKLEFGFLMDFNDEQACFFAGIHPNTLYHYQLENPDYIERKKILKQNLEMKARIALAHHILEGDVDDAKWYLERKRKDEFSTKQELGIYKEHEVEEQLHEVNTLIIEARKSLQESVQNSQ